jgi:hypothetical protein
MWFYLRCRKSHLLIEGINNFMAMIFDADFQGYFGWSDTNPGFGDSDTMSNYWYYGVSGNWLGYRAWSTATPGIKYRTGVADGTIELKYKEPHPTSVPYDLRIIYRHVDSNNYRYLLLSHLGSVVTVKQFICVAGTHSDTGLLNQTIAISGAYATESQEWLLVRMVIKGTKQVVLRIDNLNSGASIESNDLTLGSTFQTATGVGFHINGEPDWVRAFDGSFIDHIPIAADNIILDNMRLDDVSIIPFVSSGGVRINGNAVSPINIKGSGGIVAGSSALVALNFGVSGGIVVSGHAPVPVNITGSGGIVTGSSAFVSSSVGVGGGIVAEPSAFVTSSVGVSGSGGVVLAGRQIGAIENRAKVSCAKLIIPESNIPVYNETMSGGVVCGSSAINTIVNFIPVNGGVVVAGLTSIEMAIAVSGGVITSGSVLQAFTDSETMSGGVVISGRQIGAIENRAHVSCAKLIIPELYIEHTYSEAMSGGVVCSSSAINTIIDLAPATGGAVVAGWALTTNGGVLASGFAIVDGTIGVTASDGGVVGASSAVSLFEYNHSMSGGISLNGTSVDFVSIETSGGLVVGGTVIRSFLVIPPILGGAKLGSAAIVNVIYLNEVQSNGLVASGSASITFERWSTGVRGDGSSTHFVTIAFTGGIVAGSEANLAYGYRTFGGIRIGGLVAPYGTIHEPPNGISARGAKLAGRAIVTNSLNLSHEGSGSVVIEGSSVYGIKSVSIFATGGVQVTQDTSTYNLKFSKEIGFKWKQRAEINKEASFLWNTGQLNIYWYRVIGKGVNDPCLPQDPCCSRFILNIHARSLPELCEKLSKRRFKFPIESVQRFSRPAENSVVAFEEANGLNHNCNTLQEVKVCGIPECADFCVDQDLRVVGGFSMKVQVNAFKLHTSQGSVVVAGSSGYRLESIIPDFPYESEGGIEIQGESVASSNYVIGRGGINIGGKAKSQFSRWRFTGGVWPNVTPRTYGSIARNQLLNSGEQQWSLTERLFKDDGLFCSTDISFSKTSQLLVVGGFNFDLPEWAEVLSVVLRIDRISTQVGIRDKIVYLIVDDEIISENLAATATDWPFIETTRTYGSSGWRYEIDSNEIIPITREELVNPTFSVGLQVNSIYSYPTSVAKVDFINLEITYENANGSIIRISSNGSLVKGPSYHMMSTGRLTVGSTSPVVTSYRYKETASRAGVKCSGLAVLSFNEVGSGGIKIGGLPKVTPYFEEGSGGLRSSGEALVLPYWETMAGGIKLIGNSVISAGFNYTSSGQVEIYGEAFAPQLRFTHNSVGGVTTFGTSKVRMPNWSYTSDGTLTISGSSGQRAGNISIPNLVANFSMTVFQTTTSFVNDVHIGDAVGLSESVTRCGCFELPLMIDISQNMSKNNIFSKFLVRNGLTISRILKLRYNEPNDSWQCNLHYKGVSGNVNSYETWDLAFELQCTTFIGGIDLGTNVWKLAIQVVRKNLSTHEDFDTRIIVAILPDAICGSIINQLDFVVRYDTQSKFATVEPNSTIYQSTIIDNIGMFKNPAWIDEPELNLRISQSGVGKAQRRLVFSDYSLV